VVSPSRNPLTGEVDDGFVFDSAPRNAYTMAVDWTIVQSANDGRLALNSTYAFTDERNGGARREFATFDTDRQDDYAVLNARLGWYELPFLQGFLDLSLWGKNLLDEEYSLNNIHGLPHSDRGVLFAEPTSYGVDMVYTWNR
jgi:iron complex outermembrane receptor protein